MIELETRKPGRRSRKKTNMILRWIIVVFAVIILLDIASIPLRKSWSDNYFQSGQTYLDQKKYLSAELEFEKSLLIYPSNKKARDDLNLAKKAETDIGVLEQYYKERKIDAKINAFVQAKAIPGTPADAVKISKSLIESGEYQLAILSAKTATEMDSHYETGWEYYGIASFLSSRSVEIGTAAKQKYLNQVTTAKSHMSEIPEILK